MRIWHVILLTWRERKLNPKWTYTHTRHNTERYNLENQNLKRKPPKKWNPKNQIIIRTQKITKRKLIHHHFRTLFLSPLFPILSLNNNGISAFRRDPRFSITPFRSLVNLPCFDFRWFANFFTLHLFFLINFFFWCYVINVVCIEEGIWDLICDLRKSIHIGKVIKQ